MSCVSTFVEQIRNVFPVIGRLLFFLVPESCTGKSIQAKPSKIIAGHEPEKTNEMLQILGQALLVSQ